MGERLRRYMPNHVIFFVWVVDVVGGGTQLLHFLCIFRFRFWKLRRCNFWPVTKMTTNFCWWCFPVMTQFQNSIFFLVTKQIFIKFIARIHELFVFYTLSLVPVPFAALTTYDKMETPLIQTQFLVYFLVAAYKYSSIIATRNSADKTNSTNYSSGRSRAWSTHDTKKWRQPGRVRAVEIPMSWILRNEAFQNTSRVSQLVFTLSKQKCYEFLREFLAKVDGPTSVDSLARRKAGFRMYLVFLGSVVYHFLSRLHNFS